MRVKIFIVLSILFVNSFAQNLVNTLSTFSMIGAKQINENVLLISKGDARYITLTSIDKTGLTTWTQDIEVANLSGYNFNKLQILGNQENLYLIQEHTEETIIIKLNSKSGEIINTRDVKISEGAKLQWTIHDDEPYQISVDKHDLQASQIDTTNGVNKNILFTVPEKYKKNGLKVQFANQSKILSTASVLEQNHGTMHLYISEYDMSTNTNKEREIDLDLEHTSFTYNSSYDKQVYGSINSSEGFYLTGKLDIVFKKAYPTTKMGDNFIGFWLAKFNKNLELEYFIEIPFQILTYLVPADVIRKPTIIQLKEDDNGAVFICLNEVKGVIYGKKYFAYINDNGQLIMAKGGGDAYHFTEYASSGVRESAHKTKVRLMNDDWSQYVTTIFPYISPQDNLYSKAANTTFRLISKNDKYLEAEKVYNYFTFGEESLYIEYLERKKGTLNIYVD